MSGPVIQAIYCDPHATTGFAAPPGNPALDPETSDTTEFGFVFTPGFLPGFSVALDYFDISVEDTIATIGGDLTINTCLESDPANLTFRVGANNALDKDPPIVTQVSCPLPFCHGNTYPQVYDTLGRTVFINVTADF